MGIRIATRITDARKPRSTATNIDSGMLLYWRFRPIVGAGHPGAAVTGEHGIADVKNATVYVASGTLPFAPSFVPTGPAV
jgi:hypothetical protein